MTTKKSNGKKNMSCDFCGKQVMRDNFCYISFYHIYDNTVCVNCAKHLPGRCPVCGEIKGSCKHKEADE
jgi:hypothetical protein